MRILQLLFIPMFIGSFLIVKAQQQPVSNQFHSSRDLGLSIFVNFTSCPGVCDGAVFIEANGGQPPYSYVWFNGLTGTDYLNACAGIGSVTVTDALGERDSVTFLVPEGNTPLVYLGGLIITQPSNGQNNGSISVDSTQLDTSVINDFHWSLDSINFNPYFIFPHLGPGVYHIFIIDPFTGCIVRAQNEIILYDITSVESVKVDFNLYPNPVSNFLQLTSDIPLSAELIDMQGRILMFSELNTFHQIQMHDYPDGIYVVKISDGKRVSYRKIIKSRV